MELTFFKTTSGRSPVLDFIDSLAVKDQAVVLAVLENVEELGFGAKGVQFRQLQGKLWEMKIKAPSGGYRFLYVTLSVDRLLVLHAFKKKTQKAPAKELKIAMKRMKSWL